MKNIRFLLWTAAAAIFYLLPYFVEVSQAIVAGLLGLVGLVAILNIRHWYHASKFRLYGCLYLYLLSNTIFFYKHGPEAGGAVFILLVFFMHSVTANGRISLALLNKVAKLFVFGLICLFTFVLFIPLIIRYPFKLGSWYLIAAEQLPLVRTTLDGPILITIIVGFIYLLLKDKIKSAGGKFVCVMILAFLFYTLLVFNRRTIITMFFLMMPFIYFEKIKEPKWYTYLFLLTFLLPINFAIFLTYANELASIPIIHDLTLRSNDLNSEDNFRLIGWILAINAFKDISIYDMFGFHKTLVRSTDERYNNFHNGYIQLYYEQGIFGFVITLLLIIVVIRRLKYFQYISIKEYKYLFIFPIMFGLILFMCNTEAVFRKILLTNLTFVTSTFFIIKISDVIENELKHLSQQLKNLNEQT